ncbi:MULTISPECIES: hypothetical protein [unclassified Carboxylicivirga]|uniref:hypothetical protein n=1 Tax=Carboxylicivirga TaxID=1628153 RepID=UPI003D357361
MNFKAVYWTLIMSFFFASCDKEEDAYQYEYIDLHEIANLFGNSREEVRNMYQGLSIDDYNDFSSKDEFLIKTKTGNYILDIYYKIGNEQDENNSEYVVERIHGKLISESSSNSIRVLKNLIKNNFPNYPDEITKNNGYGGLGGEKVTYSNYEELFNAITENSDDYALIWIERDISYYVFIDQSTLVFSFISGEDSNQK